MAESQANTRGAGFKDISNQEFGCLRAIRITGKNRHKQMMWECLCDPSLGGCGSTTIAAGYSLRAGHTRSCGCLITKTHREVFVTHGMTKTPEYARWSAMKRRCLQPSDKRFESYGGRGIRVCDRWLIFENFIADMGPIPIAGHTIERKDNNGNYEPGNCVWATDRDQRRNQRRSRLITIGGQTQCMADWIKDSGMKPACVYRRLARGWSVERALNKE